MNSLSENESLLTLPPWTNPYLLLAITLSMALHFMILYVPFFTKLFAITSLTWAEWQGVLWISLPIIFIDEMLKWVSRAYVIPLRNAAAQASAVLALEQTADGKKTTPRRRRSNAGVSPSRKSKRA
jgi:Ca2+ transporting ATPase